MPEKPQRCRDCGRPTTECYVPVNRETWPAAAVEAYDLAGYDTAATCPVGQMKDIRRTTAGRRLGWSIDRIVRHPGYSGPPIPGLQRDVQMAGRRL